MTTDELRAMGQRLRAVRLERGHTLQDVAAATRIRLKFLEAFEASDTDPSLTDLQLRGFLRNYAAYLHLDFDAMLAAYQRLAAGQRKRLLPFRRGDDAPPLEVPIITLHSQGTVQTPPGPMPPVRGVTTNEADAASSIPRWWLGIAGVSIVALFIIGVAAIGTIALGGSSDETAEATVAPLAVDDAQATPTEDVSAPSSPTNPNTTASPSPEANTSPAPTITPSPVAGGFQMQPPAETELDMTGATNVAITVTAQQR
ncbi:MAG: helix-turn-helix domain-containing protein, partial [Anaerolineales bacterium]